MRVAGAIEQQCVRRETPGQVQIVTRENYAAFARIDPFAQRFEAIDLMMQVEMRKGFIEQQKRRVLA